MKSSNRKAEFNLSIVIVTKNRHESMLSTLNAVRSHLPLNFSGEILIIEETNDPQHVEEEGVKYFSIPKRGLGFGYVRNLALKEARGEIIVFVDDDITPAEKWLKTLLAPFKDEEVGAVGGSILPDLSEINTIGKCISFLGFPAGGLTRYVQSNGIDYETNLISTGNCALRAALAREVGGFDNLLRWGGEDQEFFSRMNSRSKTLFVPEAIVFHRQRESLGEVFFWFIRRGKADFYRTCKTIHPLSSLVFPLRSNFSLKLLVFFLALLGLFFVSGIAALALALFAPITWNLVLWHRGHKVFEKSDDKGLSKEIEEIKNAVLCKEVKWRLFILKFTMDTGQEAGRLAAFCRYLKHRIFSKPFVLTFHHLANSDPRMNAPNSKYYCSKERFEKIIEDSQKDDRSVLPLFEIIRRLKENSNSLYFEKILGVSFDDGYRSIFEPLTGLAMKGDYPSTIFIPTALVGSTNQWDQLKGLEREEIMNWSQLDDLRKKGIEIGSHTRTHVDLRKIETTTRKKEIMGSLEDIRQNLSDHDNDDRIFSYPYGAYDQEVIQIVKEAGYVGAVSNFQGNIRPKTDPWQIPRFSVCSDSDWASISRQSRSLWAKDLIKDIRDWLFGSQRETTIDPSLL